MMPHVLILKLFSNLKISTFGDMKSLANYESMFMYYQIMPKI